MLPIVKKYFVYSAITTFLIVFLFASLWITISLANPILFIVLILGLFAFKGVAQQIKGYWTRKAVQKLQPVIDIYEKECDPARFLEESAPLIQNVVGPYEVTTSWFLAFYCRGLYEVGRTEEATALYDDLRKSIDAAVTPDVKGELIINLVPATRTMLGGKYALQAIEEADQLMEQAKIPTSNGRRRYISWERANLEAQRDGDLQTLADNMHKTVENKRNSMLVRVECAERESFVYRNWELPDEERECLRFIISNGGTLQCKARAELRWKELEELE